MSTWSNARDTLGHGTPQEGAPFDNSAQLRQMQTTVVSAAPGDKWTGTAADGYAETNSKQARVLGQMAGLDQRLGAEVDRSAAVVAAGRQNLDGVKQWVLDAAAAVPQSDQREQQLLPIARKGIGDVADVVKQTHGDLNAIGGRIQAIGNEYKELGGDQGGRDLAGIDPTKKDSESKIPDSKDPNEVKRWWDSLSSAQKDQLIRDHPEKLGNLNGIPVEARSTANRAVMQQDLDHVKRAAADHHVSIDEVKAHPESYGLTPKDVARYTNADQVQKGLEHNSGKDTNFAKTYLYVYDPEAFGGKGRAAIAIGNPDEAINTAVVVPGTSHSVKEGWLSSDDAAHVYNETSKAERSGPTSVIAWMGYEAPNDLKDIRVAQTGLARQGGALLASDVNTLSTTHHAGTSTHVTVIGHSYGSTTVADASAGFHMRANDVVLLGCPGTDMARNAAAFDLPPGGHVYVGGASGDPVSYLGGSSGGLGLGNDPYVDGFGSTRFRAEVPNLASGHSHYFDVGSESLFSIGDIASGHGDGLEHDHMTAPHRTAWPSVRIPGTPIDVPMPGPGIPPGFSPPDFDPEAYRPAHDNHRHG